MTSSKCDATKRRLRLVGSKSETNNDTHNHSLYLLREKSTSMFLIYYFELHCERGTQLEYQQFRHFDLQLAKDFFLNLRICSVSAIRVERRSTAVRCCVNSFCADMMLTLSSISIFRALPASLLVLP